MLLFLLACTCSGSSMLGLPATATPEPAAPVLPTARPAATQTETVAATNTPLPPTDTPFPATDTPFPTDTLAPTLTFTIAHLVRPGNPSGTTRYMTDIITKDYAPQKKAIGGDEFPNNRYERPFTAEAMDYLPDVDITRAELRVELPWIYATISVVDSRPAGIGQTVYGVELDLDKNGRGDFLIWGASPAGADWTTDGVQVWKDSNFDVGGPRPQISDSGLGGNGYDQSLFSSGQGEDLDLAWIRPLDGGKKIQLAFKSSAIGGATSFLWSAVVDYGVRRPEWFDYNDHFTQAEAGSPLPVQTDLYPLKLLYGLDNTCRDAYGFTPVGTEANLCT
jgi:hypothetical protein